MKRNQGKLWVNYVNCKSRRFGQDLPFLIDIWNNPVYRKNLSYNSSIVTVYTYSTHKHTYLHTHIISYIYIYIFIIIYYHLFIHDIHTIYIYIYTYIIWCFGNCPESLDSGLAHAEGSLERWWERWTGICSAWAALKILDHLAPPPRVCSPEISGSLFFLSKMGHKRSVKFQYRWLVLTKDGPFHSHPRCSMYGIFTYIYSINDPNVGNYSIHGAYGHAIHCHPQRRTFVYMTVWWQQRSSMMWITRWFNGIV